MYLPLPFFWSLFSMQGSRWTLTATQTNGWCGPVKVRPDQMQIMNPIMILAFLPIFQYGVYPLIEKCGIRLGSFFSIFKIVRFIQYILLYRLILILLCENDVIEKNVCWTSDNCISFYSFWICPVSYR